MLLLVVAVILLLMLTMNFERFNNTSGRFCPDCNGKNINQCLSCFSCGYCVDKYGNAKCVSGDHKGPHNLENCKYWYSGNEFSAMMKLNGSYKCSYGPHQMSRIYWLICCSVDWFVDPLIYWLIHWSIDLLNYWMTSNQYLSQCSE